MGTLAFLQPAFLTALLALAVPILIHFIYRKKAVRWSFAAMDFLLRSNRKVARRLRFKQWLLLFLRCLLFALIALAFARPFIQHAKGKQPVLSRAIVVVLDDSMSMSYRAHPKSRTLFEMAKKRAVRLLKTLRGEDEVALLRGSVAQSSLLHEQTELTFDKKSVLDKLQKWQPSYRTTDLIGAMRRAAAITEKVKGKQPRIILISDFAQHAFDSPKMPKISSLPTIELIPVRSSKKPVNRAIIRLKTEPAPFASESAYQFTVTIQNFSTKPIRDLSVLLKIGKEPKAKGFIRLGPKAIGQKSFIVRLPRAGVYTGSVEIGTDGLQGDNRYFFALQARKRPKILLVNGDPRTIPYLDELFYVERALQGPASPFLVESIHASAALPDPSKYQAIFLVNVPALPTAWTRSLHAFVRKGGGLFLSMGNRVSTKDMNQQFETLLPRPLRNVALAAQRPDGTGIALQRYLGAVSATHPIFRTLYRDGLVFQSARVSRLMLVETGSSKRGGQSLWRFSHGPPALLERRVGQGRVLLLTTTLDRDWTDLCIRSFFQPWLRKVVTYMAGGARFQQRGALRIGQHTKLTLTHSDAITVHTPTGKTHILRPSERRIVFPGGHTPGVYRFSHNGRSSTLLPQVVNVDPIESNLTWMSNQQLKSIGYVTSKVTSATLKQSERFWPFLLFLLFIVFFLETAILRFM